MFTSEELSDCMGADGTPDVPRLAARFAAKEATLKLLRRADEALPWTSIAVHSDSHGRPSLVLSGAAAELAARAGLDGFDVSLTHEGPFAAAVVVAQERSGG